MIVNYEILRRKARSLIQETLLVNSVLDDHNENVANVAGKELREERIRIFISKGLTKNY